MTRYVLPVAFEDVFSRLLDTDVGHSEKKFNDHAPPSLPTPDCLVPRRVYASHG